MDTLADKVQRQPSSNSTAMTAMTRWLLLSCFFLTSCAARKVARTVVPAHCMSVTISSFTRACEDMGDGNMICDRVKVKVNCVTYQAAK